MMEIEKGAENLPLLCYYILDVFFCPLQLIASADYKLP